MRIRKNSNWAIVLIIGAMLLVGLVIGVGLAIAHHVSSSSSSPTPSSSSPTPSSAQSTSPSQSSSPSQSALPSQSSPSKTNVPAPPKKPGGTCSDAAAVVAHHNAMRAKHDAGPLRWSDAVAASAQTHADVCVWGHSGGPYGENIAMGPGLTCETSSRLWYDREIGGMNWHIPEGGKGSGSYFDTSGHLTAMVWKATTEIGCGVRTCPDGQNFVVCQYNPAGNTIGGFAANVGRLK